MSPNGNPRDLTTVAQDYLKVIWTIQEWSREKVSTKMLAERIGVSASTASESIRKLADQGLVDHEKYGAVTLTDAGRRAALAMVRRHRLMETFLVNELGYSWDEVHDEAEVLEHAVSDRMLDRIDAKLGHPTRDPHGDPIPAADGQVPTPPARQLSVCQDGDAGTVARISDADPEMLRYFDSVGISLDSRLRVLARRDFAGMISVAIESRRRREHHGRTGKSCGTSDLGDRLTLLRDAKSPFHRRVGVGLRLLASYGSVAGRSTTTDFVRAPSSRSSEMTCPSGAVAAYTPSMPAGSSGRPCRVSSASSTVRSRRGNVNRHAASRE